jgi:hypothetical protein
LISEELSAEENCSHVTKKEGREEWDLEIAVLEGGQLHKHLKELEVIRSQKMFGLQMQRATRSVFFILFV